MPFGMANGNPKETVFPGHDNLQFSLDGFLRLGFSLLPACGQMSDFHSAKANAISRVVRPKTGALNQ